MPSRVFPKAQLLEMLYEGGSGDIDAIEETVTGTGRWSVNYRVIFRCRTDGTHWEAYFSKGATEQQDERPWQHDGDNIACNQVVPEKHVITVYEKVPEDAPLYPP